MKISVNYIIVNRGVPENKDVISKKFMLNALHSTDSGANNL